MMTDPQTTLPSRPRQRRSLGPLVAAACILACTLPALMGLASGAAFTLFDAPVWLVILGAGAIAGVVARVRQRRGGRTDGCC